MTQQEATERIRKLLALASNAGATEAEAANAAEKAAAMMRQYEIDRDALGGAPVAQEYREEARRFSRVATWQKVLVSAIASSFGVFVYRSDGLHFYGQAHRVSAACYAFDALAENIRRAGEGVPYRDRAAFLTGAAASVAERMRAAREASNLPALIQKPPPDRRFGGCGTVTVTNRDALNAGRAAGANIGIHAGLRDHRKRLTA